jgi:hypothetical protein
MEMGDPRQRQPGSPVSNLPLTADAVSERLGAMA